MQSLIDQLEEAGGKIRFTKYINDMIWVAFMDHAKALDAVKLGSVSICGHNLSVKLKRPDWKDLLQKEMELCSNNTITLCGDKDLVRSRSSVSCCGSRSTLVAESETRIGSTLVSTLSALL